jgi:glutamate-ammonia-ligase adenylyltransferase
MIASHLGSVPQALQAHIVAAWEDYCELVTAEDIQLYQKANVLESLVKVWVSSHFVLNACKREPALLGDLIRSGDLYSSTASASYMQYLQAAMPESETDLHHILRTFRRREMVRIAWRDIAGWSELSETLMDVSQLAETAVQFALDFTYSAACERNGIPLGKDGRPLQMVVLGMGKLGAWELNYSSDIDLIFAMPEEGYFDGHKGISYTEFFTRIGRKLIQALDNVTADGFVFRVDMRLRPWGDSGALVLSFDAMEKYYREHGREWERYAMVKARAIAGDMQRAEVLQARLRPFVYRSYLDYGVFAELRELKQQVVDQQKRRGKMDNIKLGPGGIRDIEFITQVFQLIRGGRDLALQDRRLQHILVRLADHGLLPAKSVDELLTAYRFLRVVEHRLQQYKDEQTNDIPTLDIDLQRLAFSMNFPDWGAMARCLAGTREGVKEIFKQVFASPQLKELPPQAEFAWCAGQEERIAVSQKLIELGYPSGEQAYEIIALFRSSTVLERLGEKGSKAINQLMPLTISAAANTPAPAQTLQRVTLFFSRVAQRSTYLSLLLEHPLALTELLQLAAGSPWIVDHLSQDPLLLDELLNPNKLYEPLIKSELASELRQKLSTVDINDIESQILELRHFQQVYVLRVAAADITGSILLITVSDYLSDIAEVILEAATRLAWQAISSKSGLPQKDMEELSGLGVIALGGLGSRDLSYDSDLHIELIWRGEDAVGASLAQLPGGAANFYKMVASRLNLLLSSRMVSGIIYRLYTPGDSERGHALLISDMPGYQKRDLTDLERCRYVQARYLFGDSHLAGEFSAYRQQLLSSGCSLGQIAVVLQQLREDWSGTSLFSLDYGIGGLGDIRSIVTSGVLCHSNEYPELGQDVETMSLLHALVSTGFISMDDYRVLQRSYMKYREKLHVLDLQHVDHFVPRADVVELSSGVEQVYSRLMILC